ncbi:hypothetical protein NUU61_009363 [Penicillium alfredii]|uniref:Uncharacterized protein n=1 Tax=Penicillium alfredii TaxID=1506179 RepID=A0A9W9EN54_9EURO|nr:uncharacterized protein NUU61_009363 [Penicillium alfredii]KAJ5084784.1 hypothetical protein NUU61_009363 [Penicillium alfredii]
MGVLNIVFRMYSLEKPWEIPHEKQESARKLSKTRKVEVFLRSAFDQPSTTGSFRSAFVPPSAASYFRLAFVQSAALWKESYFRLAFIPSAAVRRR